MAYSYFDAERYKSVAISELSAPEQQIQERDTHNWLQVLIPTVFIDKSKLTFSEREMGITVLKRVPDLERHSVENAVRGVFADLAQPQFVNSEEAIQDIINATMTNIQRDKQFSQPLTVKCAYEPEVAGDCYEMTRLPGSGQSLAYDRYKESTAQNADDILRFYQRIPRQEECDIAPMVVINRIPATQHGAEPHKQFVIAEPEKADVVQSRQAGQHQLPTVAAQDLKRCCEINRANAQNVFKDDEQYSFQPQITEVAREKTFSAEMEKIEQRIAVYLQHREETIKLVAKRELDREMKECSFIPVINNYADQEGDIYERYCINRDTRAELERQIECSKETESRTVRKPSKPQPRAQPKPAMGLTMAGTACVE